MASRFGYRPQRDPKERLTFLFREINVLLWSDPPLDPRRQKACEDFVRQMKAINRMEVPGILDEPRRSQR